MFHSQKFLLMPYLYVLLDDLLWTSAIPRFCKELYVPSMYSLSEIFLKIILKPFLKRLTSSRKRVASVMTRCKYSYLIQKFSNINNTLKPIFLIFFPTKTNVSELCIIVYPQQSSLYSVEVIPDIDRSCALDQRLPSAVVFVFSRSDSRHRSCLFY